MKMNTRPILLGITSALKVEVSRLKTASPVISIQKYIKEHRSNQLSSFNNDLENGSNFFILHRFTLERPNKVAQKMGGSCLKQEVAT
jgi:hypothetical protein